MEWGKTREIKMRRNKHQRVRKLLLDHRPRGGLRWGSLSNLKGRRADKKSANKFMLACILNYRMKAEQVWNNAKRFAEDELGDPKYLWETIIDIRRWNSDTVRRRYRLHYLSAAHKRVRRIAKEIVEHYKGDARNIWKNQTPDDIRKRLEGMRVGPQISRMIVGALHDTKQISGAGELKADIHVRRVLGRVFTGQVVSADDAHRIAKQMEPRKSWKLDAPLYLLGKSTCIPTNPDCEDCYLPKECKYYKTNA